MAEFETKDSGVREEYDSGMRRDTQEGKARFDLLFPEGVPYEEQFLTRVAELLDRGVEKYGERNWEKANSDVELRRFKASAARHMAQWQAGETDEDHAAAVVFNLLAYETTKRTVEQIALEKGVDLSSYIIGKIIMDTGKEEFNGSNTEEEVVSLPYAWAGPFAGKQPCYTGDPNCSVCYPGRI